MVNLETLTVALEHGDTESALEPARQYVAQEKMARAFTGVAIPSLIQSHGLKEGMFTFQAGGYRLEISRVSD